MDFLITLLIVIGTIISVRVFATLMVRLVMRIDNAVKTRKAQARIVADPATYVNHGVIRESEAYLKDAVPPNGRIISYGEVVEYEPPPRGGTLPKFSDYPLCLTFMAEDSHYVLMMDGCILATDRPDVEVIDQYYSTARVRVMGNVFGNVPTFLTQMPERDRNQGPAPTSLPHRPLTVEMVAQTLTFNDGAVEIVTGAVRHGTYATVICQGYIWHGVRIREAVSAVDDQIILLEPTPPRPQGSSFILPRDMFVDGVWHRAGTLIETPTISGLNEEGFLRLVSHPGVHIKDGKISVPVQEPTKAVEYQPEVIPRKLRKPLW